MNGEMTLQTARAVVEEVHGKLVAIGLPEGNEAKEAREVYRAAMECYDEMARGWHNEDMMASALIDALDSAGSVALHEAGGWDGWPKEPLAHVSPNARRVLANPESEAGKAYTALDELRGANIHALMGVRGLWLAELTPKDAKIPVGEGESHPMQDYRWWNARGGMYDWLVMLVNRRCGDLGGVQHAAYWIHDAAQEITKAAWCKEEVRRLEEGIGRTVVEVATGAELDGKPEPSPWTKLFGKNSPPDLPGDETRRERLMRLGKLLAEAKERHAGYANWAQLAQFAVKD